MQSKRFISSGVVVIKRCALGIFYPHDDICLYDPFIHWSVLYTRDSNIIGRNSVPFKFLDLSSRRIICFWKINTFVANIPNTLNYQTVKFKATWREKYVFFIVIIIYSLLYHVYSFILYSFNIGDFYLQGELFLRFIEAYSTRVSNNHWSKFSTLNELCEFQAFRQGETNH